jgi:hypothetical protein
MIRVIGIIFQVCDTLIEVEDSSVTEVQAKSKPGSFHGYVVDTTQVIVCLDLSFTQSGVEHIPVDTVVSPDIQSTQ